MNATRIYHHRYTIYRAYRSFKAMTSNRCGICWEILDIAISNATNRMDKSSKMAQSTAQHNGNRMLNGRLTLDNFVLAHHTHSLILQQTCKYTISWNQSFTVCSIVNASDTTRRALCLQDGQRSRTCKRTRFMYAIQTQLCTTLKRIGHISSILQIHAIITLFSRRPRNRKPRGGLRTNAANLNSRLLSKFNNGRTWLSLAVIPASNT